MKNICIRFLDYTFNLLLNRLDQQVLLAEFSCKPVSQTHTFVNGFRCIFAMFHQKIAQISAHLMVYYQRLSIEKTSGFPHYIEHQLVGEKTRFSHVTFFSKYCYLFFLPMIVPVCTNNTKSGKMDCCC